MYEYHIYNEVTKEESIIFGYSIEDAFRRRPSLNESEWAVWHSEYID